MGTITVEEQFHPKVLAIKKTDRKFHDVNDFIGCFK